MPKAVEEGRGVGSGSCVSISLSLTRQNFFSHHGRKILRYLSTFPCTVAGELRTWHQLSARRSPPPPFRPSALFCPFCPFSPPKIAQTPQSARHFPFTPQRVTVIPYKSSSFRSNFRLPLSSRFQLFIFNPEGPSPPLLYFGRPYRLSVSRCFSRRRYGARLLPSSLLSSPRPLSPPRSPPHRLRLRLLHLSSFFFFSPPRALGLVRISQALATWFDLE